MPAPAPSNDRRDIADVIPTSLDFVSWLF